MTWTAWPNLAAGYWAYDAGPITFLPDPPTVLPAGTTQLMWIVTADTVSFASQVAGFGDDNRWQVSITDYGGGTPAQREGYSSSAVDATASWRLTIAVNTGDGTTEPTLDPATLMPSAEDYSTTLTWYPDFRHRFWLAEIGTVTTSGQIPNAVAQLPDPALAGEIDFFLYAGDLDTLRDQQLFGGGATVYDAYAYWNNDGSTGDGVNKDFSPFTDLPKTLFLGFFGPDYADSFDPAVPPPLTPAQVLAPPPPPRLPFDGELEELHSESDVVLAAAGDGTDLFVALEPVDSSSAITVSGLPFLIALDPVESSSAISMTYKLRARVALVPVDSTSSVVLLSSAGTGAGDGVPGSTGPLTTLSDATVSDNPPITLALVLQATLQTIPGGYPLDPEWPAELPDLSYDDNDTIPPASVTTIPAPDPTGTGTGASTSPPVVPPPEGPPTMGGTIVTGPYSPTTFGFGPYGTYEPIRAKTGLVGVGVNRVDLTDNSGPTWHITSGGIYDLQRVRRLVIIDTTEDVAFMRSSIEGDFFQASSSGLFQLYSSKLNDNVKFYDCDFIPAQPSEWWNALHGHGYQAHRCYVANTTDGFGVFNSYGPNANVGIYGCLVENLAFFSPNSEHMSDAVPGSHNDTIQWHGQKYLEVIGNALKGVLDPAIGAASLDLAHRDPVAGGGPHNPQAISSSPYGYNASYPHLQSNSVLQITNGTGPAGQLNWRKNFVYGGAVAINIGGGGGNYPDLGTLADSVFHADTQRYGQVLIGGPGKTTNVNLAISGNTKQDGTPIKVIVSAGSTLTPAVR